jgi:hypothetical protein
MFWYEHFYKKHSIVWNTTYYTSSLYKQLCIVVSVLQVQHGLAIAHHIIIKSHFI